MYENSNNEEKHKVFISYYHDEDQKYKDYIDKYLSKDIINKSVMENDINSDNSDEYIKKLIREDYISDTSVIVVLTGKNTRTRKHVDWEIYAGLRESINGNSGLVGIALPEILINGSQYYFEDIPARLADNIKSGYAQMYTWDYATQNFKDIIDTAFNNRIKLRDNINNTRNQMQNNTTGR